MIARRSSKAQKVEPPGAAEREPSPSEEMYLKTLERLEREGRPTAANLARGLHVSAASTTAMVRRLTEFGWIAAEGRELHLTLAGRRLAMRTVRRHRLAERLLTDVLGIPWDQVHDPACALEHAMNDVVTDRIEASLGHPATCPHGHPIPDRDGVLAVQDGVGLDTVAPGERARVLRISREEPEILSYLGALGLVPGAVATVQMAAPFGGPLLVRVGRARYALGREVASQIVVEGVPAGGTG